MSPQAEVEVRECAVCGDRTPHRTAASRGSPGPVAVVTGLVVVIGLCLASGSGAALFLAGLVGLALIAVLARALRAGGPDCERCRGREWMARHPGPYSGPRRKVVYFGFLGESVALTAYERTAPPPPRPRG